MMFLTCFPMEEIVGMVELKCFMLVPPSQCSMVSYSLNERLDESLTSS